MTRMEEENAKLRAILEQVRLDLGPALAVLSEQTSKGPEDWFVGLAYVQCYTIEEQLK